MPDRVSTHPVFACDTALAARQEGSHYSTGDFGTLNVPVPLGYTLRRDIPPELWVNGAPAGAMLTGPAPATGGPSSTSPAQLSAVLELEHEEGV